MENGFILVMLVKNVIREGTMEYLLSTENLVKQFKKYKAVNEVNLHIRKGDIYGFIGRNGAGKTTFLKMISGLSHPTSGEITMFGCKGNQLYEQNVFGRVGTLIEAPGIYPKLSAYDNMLLRCKMLGIKDNHKIDELLELMGLQAAAKKKTKTFSLGMKQRLGIALALLGDPELLVLDEPINGLDPQGIVEMRNILKDLNEKRGITIIISSHILEELNKVATVFGVIHEGRLLKEFTMEEFDANSAEYIAIKVDDVQKAKAVLSDMGIRQCDIIDQETLTVSEQLQESSKIASTLLNHGIVLKSINVEKPSLEELYFELTGGATNA